MKKAKLLDLFSGAGGFSLGFEAAGFETVAFSEIEPFPCRVLAHRWPEVPNLGDVCQIDGEEIRERFGPIDVVSFGSPCQDWSVAGKRLGLEGERSSLFHEAIRIIQGVRPEFAIFENVPGLFSSAGGWDFAAVLDEMAESGALDIAWSVLDAQWFGVPQRRRRVFVVCDFRGERAGEILSLSEGVCRDTPPSREAREEAAGSSVPSVASTLGGGAGQRGWADDTDRMTFVPEVAGGQPTRYGKGVNTTADDGAIVPVSFASQNSPEQGDEVIENGCALVRANTTPAVVFAENQRGEVRTSGTHPQLTTGGGKPGQGYPAVAFQNTGHGWWNQTETGQTLTNPDNGSGREGNVALQGMAVRRLTPLECERLMGWPDQHTNIPGASDSGRYRACGNGVAAPVVQWIAERMRRVL